MTHAPLTPPLPLLPDAFGLPASAGAVDLIQTHIGWIYTCGEYAFKLKKQVQFDFLDFTTLEKRKWACQREIELNSRLCPGLYMGLVPVVKDAAGNVRVDIKLVNQSDPPGLVDWCVWMKRMSGERMLDRLLDGDAVTESDVRSISEVLVQFFRKQKEARKPGVTSYFKNFITNVNENFREARALPVYMLSPAELDFLEKRGRGFLRKYSRLIEQREKVGMVVDGHGDLRSENICLPENAPPILFDCIEFNDRFRICDTALDTAYLAMDLDSRGRSDLSAVLEREYRSKFDPDLSDSIWNFYLGYRAFVKAKVAAWIASDLSVPTEKRANSTEQCRDLFGLAIRYAMRSEPVLILCCGPAGSGKSTLAQHLALTLGCEHLATDVLRDEIAPRTSPAAERYSSANSERVYMLAFERTAKELQRKKPVILDGTFLTADRRKQALRVAREQKIPAILIWADCPPSRMEEHFTSRKQEGALLGSEADLSVSVTHQRQFETPTASEGFAARVRIDTSGSKEKSQTEVWLKTLDALTHIL